MAATHSAASHTTSLLGKDPASGRISLLSSLLFWPYHVGLQAKLWKRRALSKEPLHNKVAPGLFIGGWPARPELLPPTQPVVMDVTCELPNNSGAKGGDYLNLPTWDTYAPSPELIERGVRWALAHRAAGRDVYVHCAHGHGRSATVLAALIMEAELAGDWKAAVKLMQAARPKVRLNKFQAEMLTDWAAKHGGACKATNLVSSPS